MKALFFLIPALFVVGWVANKSVTVPLALAEIEDLRGKFAIGTTSEQVVVLQEILRMDPTIYPEGSLTGFYGIQTIRAVERFQCKYMNLCSGTPDGNGYGLAGPATRAKIKEVMSTFQQTGDENTLLSEEVEEVIGIEEKNINNESTTTDELFEVVDSDVSENMNEDNLSNIRDESVNTPKPQKVVESTTFLQNIIINIHLGTRALIDLIK